MPDRTRPGQVAFRNQHWLAGQAERLAVAEITLFRRAYRRWHGADPGEAQLDRLFCAYLRDGHIPSWLADYVRRQPPGAVEAPAPLLKRLIALAGLWSARRAQRSRAGARLAA